MLARYIFLFLTMTAGSYAFGMPFPNNATNTIGTHVNACRNIDAAMANTIAANHEMAVEIITPEGGMIDSEVGNLMGMPGIPVLVPFNFNVEQRREVMGRRRAVMAEIRSRGSNVEQRREVMGRRRAVMAEIRSRGSYDNGRPYMHPRILEIDDTDDDHYYRWSYFTPGLLVRGFLGAPDYNQCQHERVMNELLARTHIRSAQAAASAALARAALPFAAASAARARNLNMTQTDQMLNAARIDYTRAMHQFRNFDQTPPYEVNPQIVGEDPFLDATLEILHLRRALRFRMEVQRTNYMVITLAHDGGISIQVVLNNPLARFFSNTDDPNDGLSDMSGVLGRFMRRNFPDAP